MWLGSRVLAFGPFNVGDVFVCRARTIRSPGIRLEWARYTVAFNRIAPGGVNTVMTAKLPEYVIAESTERGPLRRMTDPDEIAAVHLFLTGGEASFVACQVICADSDVTVGA